MTGAADLRARLPLRGQAPPGLASQVPPARRPPGAEDHRPRLDRARAPAGRLLDQAHRRGLAPPPARRGRRRHAARHASAPARPSPTPAPSTCATSTRTASASPPRCATTTRSSATTSSRTSASHPARGPHRRASRALGRHRDRPVAPDGQPNAREDDHRLPRLHGASPKAPPPPVQPGRRRREAPHRHANRDRGLLPGGGHGARPSRRLRPGRRDLPHRRLHRPPPRRARRPPLARRRLPRLGHPSPSELHERPPHLAEVRQGPLRPDGTEGRRGPRPPRPARVLHRRRRPRLLRHRRRLPRRLSALEALPSRARTSRPPRRSASTTSATRSARESSASPTSAESRSGWATPTSRRRCSTSTTSRAHRTPPSWALRSNRRHRPHPTSTPRARADSSREPRGFATAERAERDQDLTSAVIRKARRRYLEAG